MQPYFYDFILGTNTPALLLSIIDNVPHVGYVIAIFNGHRGNKYEPEVET